MGYKFPDKHPLAHDNFGFVNGESEAVLTALPSMNCSASSTSNAGTYNIVPSGAVAQNYAFSYQNGTLTISKRQIHALPDNVSREYGDVNRVHFKLSQFLMLLYFQAS